ncbi:MAG: carboxypeptidase regulatory-like domain-containing protein [Thermoanaerobaculia bacterium]
MIDADGKGVSGARVVWSACRTEEKALADATSGVEPQALGEAKTDDTGRFRLAFEKAAGDVALVVRLTGGAEIDLPGPYDSREDSEVDEIVLPSMTTRLAGRVVDEAGKAVPGARVEASSSFRSDGEWRLSWTTSTGDDGAFAFVGVPDPPLSVIVRANGYPTIERWRPPAKGDERIVVKRGGAVHGAVLDPAGKPAARAIVVVGDKAVECDSEGGFRLAGVRTGSLSVRAVWRDELIGSKTVRFAAGQEAEVRLLLSRGAAIPGTVVDEATRQPVRGARFFAGVALHAAAFARPRARSDARGRFRIGGLTAGEYAVVALADGFLPALVAAVVDSGGPHSVAIALRRAASLAGQVKDESGRPVEGAQVSWSLASRSAAMPSRRDGSFRFKGLESLRNAVLEAQKAGFAPARLYGVSARPGEEKRGLILVLRKGLEARGRVVDLDGKPVAGARVHVTPEKERGRFFGSFLGESRPAAVSDAEGAFRVAGLEAGVYRVAVFREAFVDRVAPSLEVRADGPNQWRPILLALGASIAGQVLAPDGKPVAGALVTTLSSDVRPARATTDADGRFRLEDLAPQTRTSLTFTAEGFARAEQNATPPAEDLRIVLKATGILRGRVEDAASKKPVTAFTVSIRPTSPDGFGSYERKSVAIQSEGGAFEMPDVPPGTWSVRASAPGYQPGWVAAGEVGEGQVLEGIVLALQKGLSLSGRVFDPRGQGLPNAAVSWEPARRGTGDYSESSVGRRRETTSDADGRYSFEGLPPGKLTVKAKHPDYLPAEKVVSPETESTADLAFEKGVRVAGTFVDRDGRTPVGGAQVFLVESGREYAYRGEHSEMTDAFGRFAFENVNAGRHRVTASGAVARDIVVAEGQGVPNVLLEKRSGTLVRGVVSWLPKPRLGGLRVWANTDDSQSDTTTDEEGHFVLRDVAPGRVRVSASLPGNLTRTVSKSVEIAEGEGEASVEIVFEGTSRLFGRVTKADRPLDNVLVSAVSDPPRQDAAGAMDRTDQDGRYLVDGLSDGGYRVSIFGNGISYQKPGITVSGETQADIALPSGAVRGRITDAASGEPLVEAQIETHPQMARRTGTTDAEGSYSIEGFDAGSVTVIVRKDGYQWKSSTVAVVSEPVELSFALARTAGLPVRALDGLTGLPLRSIWVFAYAENGLAAFTGGVSLDLEGRGEIPSLGPGRYTLQLLAPGHPYAVRHIPTLLVPGPPLTVAFRPGGVLEIRSSEALAARLMDANAAAFAVASRAGRPLTIQPPLHRIDRLEPGAYVLVVKGPAGEKSIPVNVAEGKTTTVDLR